MLKVLSFVYTAKNYSKVVCNVSLSTRYVHMNTYYQTYKSSIILYIANWDLHGPIKNGTSNTQLVQDSHIWSPFHVLNHSCKWLESALLFALLPRI